MNRRSFLIGSVGLLAAPAIVRASSIMPVRAWRPAKWRELLYADSEWFRLYSGYDTLNIEPKDVLTAAEYQWRQGPMQIDGLDLTACTEAELRTVKARLVRLLAA